MASEDKIEVSLDLISTGALKALDGFSKTVTKTFMKMDVDLGKVTKGFGNMAGKIFTVQNAAIAAGSAVVAFLGSKQVIDKAIAQEEAVNSVALALARTGKYSKEALTDMENWASALSESTIYGDEEILSQASLAMAFGATSEQAKMMTRAAIEMSAATGKGLGETTRQVSKTLSGLSGELGEVNIRVKNLTKEQLRSGEAAKILLEQYGGTAIGKIRTFSGALTQNKGLFSDLLEQVGFLITKNPVVIEGIQALSKVFIQMADYLQRNRDQIIAFVNEGLVAIVDSAPYVIKTLQGTVSILSGLTKMLSLATAGVGILTKAFLEVEVVKFLFDAIVLTIGKVTGGIIDLLSVLVKLPVVSDVLEAMGANVDELSASLERAANASYDVLDSFNGDTAIKALDTMNEMAFKIADGADEVRDNLNGALEEGIAKAKSLSNTIKNISSKGQVELKVANNEESVKASIDNYQQLLEMMFGGSRGAKIGDALINGVMSGIKNGKEGARQMLSSVGGAVADAFLPGIGAVVGPMIDLLSQGPEAVRQMVRDFMQAIPDLLSNIVEALPVLIEEFTKQLPILINKILEKLPDMIDALVEALPDIINAFIEAIPLIIDGIIENLPKIIEAVIRSIPKIIEALVKATPKFVMALINSLVKNAGKITSAIIEGLAEGISGLFGGMFGGGILGGGLGGGAGLIGSTENGSGIYGATVKAFRDIEKGISGFFEKTFGIKFAKGGEVPSGFPNDTLPARLSSGEYVIDRGLTQDLKRMVKERDSSANTALLARLVNLLEQPQTVQSSVKLNQREFANIILQLNRTNQRMA